MHTIQVHTGAEGKALIGRASRVAHAEAPSEHAREIRRRRGAPAHAQYASVAARAPAWGREGPAAAPLSGMKGWGSTAPSSSLQRHGMPAGPGPAPAPRGGAAPAQPVRSGLGPDPRHSPRRRLRPRHRIARKEAGRAALLAPLAPRDRYRSPRPAVSGRRACGDPRARPDRPSSRGCGCPPRGLLRPRPPGPLLGAEVLPSCTGLRTEPCPTSSELD